MARASDNTIGQTLKKRAQPHLKKQWVIPPDASAAFVAAMEDVLEVYHRPRDPTRPVVCVDETSKQLISETRVPIEDAPGRAKRFDYEYRRNGTANLFMIFSPLEGWRRVEVTDRHTAVDYAQVLKQLADVDFAAAEKIVPVQDNLNTHTPASLYQAFPAAQARRLVERFEWHYTPKHKDGRTRRVALDSPGLLADEAVGTGHVSRPAPDVFWKARTHQPGPEPVLTNTIVIAGEEVSSHFRKSAHRLDRLGKRYLRRLLLVVNVARQEDIRRAVLNGELSQRADDGLPGIL